MLSQFLGLTRWNAVRAYSAAATVTRNTAKPLFSRKTFLVDYYKHLNDNNEILLYVHHNNIPKKDNKEIRSTLKKHGAQFNVISNSLYRVYLRSAHEDDPALVEASSKNKKNTHPLLPLLNGPNAVITVPKSDPTVVAQVMKLLNAHKEKLFLIGARIETSVYDAAQVNQYKDLPNKEQLQGQLTGLLTILGGAGLVRTLESAGTHMYLTLDQRRKDMDDKE